MATSAHTGNLSTPHWPAVADQLIRVTTALAVAAVAAVISYRHAYELVTTHGETGLTARLLPFTVHGLILAASMLILDASRRHRSVPPLARCHTNRAASAPVHDASAAPAGAPAVEQTVWAWHHAGRS